MQDRRIAKTYISQTFFLLKPAAFRDIPASLASCIIINKLVGSQN